MIKVQLNNVEVELKSLDKRVLFDSIQRCLADNTNTDNTNTDNTNTDNTDPVNNSV